MNRTYLVTCFVTLFLVALARISVSSASEGALASPAVASSHDWSDGHGASLPAGVSTEWWAETQNTIHQLQQQANPDVAVPLRPRGSWKAEGNQESAQFGYSVGTAGDVNGDGYGDVIVGAPYYDHGERTEGRVFVYHGSASGASLTPNWRAESNQEDAWFGYSVGTAGDVNGDGYDDVIVGAPQYENGETMEGRALVYYGSVSGLSLTPDWAAENNQANAEFGSSVGTAGDVNGDGYDDVIVGADEYDNGETNEGRAYVYYGSASGLSLTPDWTAESNQAEAEFGWSVGTAGDVNGDDYDDVIVGAIFYDNGQTDEGRAFAYYGSASGLSLTSDWTAESNQVRAQFGVSVGAAGDVNGDGYQDVIVGADRFETYEYDNGRVFVYYGSASGLSLTPDWTAEGDKLNAHLGYSVGKAGDFNDDGYGDVIVGAPHFTNGQSREGRAYGYYGSASGLSRTPDRMAESDQAWAEFGYSVGTAGDVNADGYDDAIVGTPKYHHGHFEEGAAVVFRGRRQ